MSAAKKTRVEREIEFRQLMLANPDKVKRLWQQVKGIPAVSAPAGTAGSFAGQEMVADILAAEYPDG